MSLFNNLINQYYQCAMRVSFNSLLFNMKRVSICCNHFQQVVKSSESFPKVMQSINTRISYKPGGVFCFVLFSFVVFISSQ